MCSSAIKYRVPLVFLLLCALQACSIKEDREVCPCFLSVVRPDPEDGLQGEVYLFLATGEYGREEKIGEGERQVCDIEVPRTQLRLIAVSGTAGGLADKSGIRVEEGEAFPPVYYYKTDLDTRCNRLRDTVQLHKNYCKLTVLGDIPDTFTCVIAGSSCGFDLDGNILQGSFRSPLSREVAGLSCRVPRQADTSLRLELYREGALARSFPIGDVIAGSGYDWTVEDLEDVEVYLDYRETASGFTADLWVHRITFYYEF